MSSDSEDDCYGNIVRTLQNLKRKYQECDIQSSNLLDSRELDDILKQNLLPAKIGNVCQVQTLDKSTVTSHLGNQKGPSSGKRITRSASKKLEQTNDIVELATEIPCVTQCRPHNENGDVSMCMQKTKRGKGRGRCRNGQGGNARQLTLSTLNRTRGRHSQDISNFMNPSHITHPIISVGNTDEYLDQLNNQTLFSCKRKCDVIDVEDSTLIDNEEISVKVYWQSYKIFKFMIRKFQKFTQIFDYFATREKVTHDKLLFTYNEQIISPDDTPDTINYNFVKFIDGGIVSQSISHTVTEKKRMNNVGDGVKLKFQCQNLKNPVEITIQHNDTLLLAMLKCAEHLEQPLEKLKFELDGDSISGKSTTKDLDLEGGECIDVRIIK